MNLLTDWQNKLAHKIRAVVVDDSAFMRKSLSILLESSGEIEIVGAARDGLEGYNLVKLLKPDIVTLDVEMPKMDGLTALQMIMNDCPVPVLMVSSLTTEGAEATIKALELGAVDFIPKDLSFVNVNIINIKEELIRKVKEIVRHRSLTNRLTRLRKVAGNKSTFGDTSEFLGKSLPQIEYNAIALGISTGGPMSLQKVIPNLKKDISCPVFIVQHMPAKFTKSLAERLNNISQVEVKEAENDEVVKNGVVYIAPGGFHLSLTKNDSQVCVSISEEPSNTTIRPSVDVLINSAIGIYGKSLLGVIMTGMGRDGYEGIKELKRIGGYSIAQNENTCIVYGMPRAIVDADLADAILPLGKIAEEINKVV